MLYIKIINYFKDKLLWNRWNLQKKIFFSDVCKNQLQANLASCLFLYKILLELRFTHHLQ